MLFKDKSYFQILLISFFSILIDYFLFINTDTPPGWDQGYHITNVFKISNILNFSELNFFQKIDEILNVSETYRGPLTYLISALTLNLFKFNSYIFLYLSNHIYNTFCIILVYKIGKIIRDSNTGLIASIIYTLSPIIINQRNDFLIDLSLTSFYTLSILSLTKWHFDKDKNISIYSIISGLSVGFLFLIRPTSLILLILPITIIFYQKFEQSKINKKKLFEILIFIIISFLITFPWFSRHWITIISSIINAWQWGVKYQDGLEYNTLGGWLYYFKEFPSMIGTFNFGFIIISLFFGFIKYKKKLIYEINNKFKIHIWLLTFMINNFLIISLMSTKDPRFLLPLYPLICIYISLFFNILKSKALIHKYILILILIFSLFLNNPFIKVSFGIFKKDNFLNSWYHKDILEEINKDNPELKSILGFIPDTKEINTFNFEAEAMRQNENIAVRQIISNESSYKDDLKYFDWFLIKTSDQGIMHNKSKYLLHKYLLNNDSFDIHKSYFLPDNSVVYLMKRKSINSQILERKCSSNNTNIELRQIPNGINIKLNSKGDIIKSSNLLIDFKDLNKQYFANVSIANGIFNKSFDKNKCYQVSQDIPYIFDSQELNENLSFESKLIRKNGIISEIKSTNKSFVFNADKRDNKILYENKIDKVKTLGRQLRLGELGELFDLVGILNQSDPKQVYLENSEIIYKYRYKQNNNIEDLYSLLISQILQKKINDANHTIDKIIQIDKYNGNVFFVKSILNIFLLESKEARKSLNVTYKLNKSNEVKDLIHIADVLINLLNFNLIKAFNTLKYIN